MMRPSRLAFALVLCAAAVVGCSEDDEPSSWSHGPGDGGVEGASPETGLDSGIEEADTSDGEDGSEEGGTEAGPDALLPCPSDMVLVETWCVDRFEAPNREGELPLVMFHFDEAESWCLSRGKRLCFDDEWTRVCGGEQGMSYPYGDSHDPGVCTDDKLWRAYDQGLLNGWPWTIDTDVVESILQLLDAAREKGASGVAAADHVQWLYQAEPSGSRAGCTTGDGAYDLCGNVEEWTRRRSGSTAGFHGNLKGRYWAETRTCQNSITTHGDQFRFYEIGFRCCLDLP
jgi:hypothetical protein